MNPFHNCFFITKRMTGGRLLCTRGNSYVIMDDKIAIMDTADARVTDKWFPVYFSIYSISCQHNINVSPSIESSGTLSVILKVRQ